MITASDFRKIAREYLDRVIERKTFTSRFLDLFYGIHQNGDADAINLGYAIESPLTKAIAGIITENELRDAVSQCLLDVHVDAEFRLETGVARVICESYSSYAPARIQFSH